MVQWNTGWKYKRHGILQKRILALFPEPIGIGYKTCFYFAPREGTDWRAKSRASSHFSGLILYSYYSYSILNVLILFLDPGYNHSFGKLCNFLFSFFKLGSLRDMQMLCRFWQSEIYRKGGNLTLSRGLKLVFLFHLAPHHLGQQYFLHVPCRGNQYHHCSGGRWECSHPGHKRYRSSWWALKIVLEMTPPTQPIPSVHPSDNCWLLWEFTGHGKVMCVHSREPNLFPALFLSKGRAYRRSGAQTGICCLLGCVHGTA